ncbi:MAG: L,D-transpeptidase [Candidatus Dormibacteria bacterium]
MRTRIVGGLTSALVGLTMFGAVATGGSQLALAASPSGPCTSVALAATPGQPAAPGTQITLSGSASCGSAPSYAYFERTGDSGPWDLIWGWTQGGHTFDTAGLADGTYQFLVWATDGPLTTPQVQSPVSYSLVTPAPCSSMTVIASPDSPTGTPATVSAAAACAAAATYAYFYRPLGGGWTLAQGWTTDSAYSYDTNGWAAGQYELLVWVGDDAQTTPQLQASASYTVTRPASGCSGGGMLTSSSATAVGDPVTVTVNPDCQLGYAPRYAYFYASAGGGWTLVQGWTGAPTFTFSTAGWPAGSYSVMAWIGSANDAPLAETAALPLTLQTSPAGGAAADPGPGKVIVISLSAQSLTAYDNGQVVLTTPITTGMPGLRTPTGIFSIHWKQTPYLFISPWPQGSRYYYPPSWTTWVMNFLTGGYFIHNAPWEPASAYGPGSENGPDASHGCVHVPYSAMQFLFGWTPDGTRVVVAS